MLLQGILLGISLSFLIGPLFFTVVQAGIQQGFRAGIAVASGIWASDILFVLLILGGVEYLTAIVHLNGFRLWSGILGGLILIAFGAGSFFSKSKKGQPGDSGQPVVIHMSYQNWWLRGFLINTINPGTIFFWLGIVSAVVVPNAWSRRESLVFFGGMLGTLVLTDSLKAWAAKAIRRWLTPQHIRLVQKGIGLVLMVFGVVLLGRAFWAPA